jgi:hypothetical protein
VTAVTMLLLPNVTADFSERYAVPAMPVVCLAAAFAFVSLKREAATPLAADGQPADDRADQQPPDGAVASGASTETESDDTGTAIPAQPVPASSRTGPPTERSTDEPTA